MAFLSSAAKFIKNNPILFGILILGLVSRFIIVYPGYYSHGDEIMYGQSLYMITHKTLSMQSHWLGYPPLIGWIMMVAFYFIFIPLAWVNYFFTHFTDVVLILGGISQNVTAGMVGFERIFNKEIIGHGSINALYWGRYTTAFFGTGVILFTYLTAKNFFGKKLIGILAGLFVALNYRLILSSHIGFIDMYNVFFLMAVFWSISVLIKKPDFKNYLTTWILVSLSFLTKYQIYALFPFLIAHFVISWRFADDDKAKLLRYLFNKMAVLGGAISLAIILLSHIHYFPYWQKILEAHKYEVLKYGFGTNIFNIYPISYFFHVGIGETLSFLALAGILIGLIIAKYRLSSLLLLSVLPISAYLYLYYSQGGFFTRNLIFVIPILLIFASLAIHYFFDIVWRKKGIFWNTGAIAFIFASVIFGLKDHIKNDLILEKIYSQKPFALQAKEWTEKNINGDITLATYDNNPTAKDKQVSVKSLPYLDKVFSYVEMKEEGYNMAILDIIDIQGSFTWWMKQPPEFGLKFWDKPNDLLSQSYIALALREFLWAHTVKAFQSPWQASGHNFVVVKLDKDPTLEFLPKISYIFEDNKWIPLNFLPQDKNELLVDNFGRDGTKALVIKSRGRFPGSVRWQSPSISVKPGFGYKVVGWIKNGSDSIKDLRDGFLRLDFYNQKVPISITSRPIVSFVTERIYGGSGWHQVEITAVTPETTNIAAIGFQSDNPQTSFYLDEVEVFETKDSQPKSEYQPVLILDDDLFLPNNRGIL